MKIKLLTALLVLLLSLACTEDGGSDVAITSSSIVELAAVENQSSTVDFQASSGWTATTTADWLSFAPARGEAGNATIKLTTNQTNRTKSQRTAQLLITSGSTRKTVTVIQRGDYAVFDREEYLVSAAGGTLTLGFTVNMSDPSKLQIAYTKANWINWTDESRATRASDVKGQTKVLTVQPNTSAEGRTSALALGYQGSDGNFIALDTAYVYQQGLTDDYESTDFTADGTVTQLQKATQGKGIAIVLMGDGFGDLDISDGTYRQTMEQAMEHLFSEEPIHSLRHYFDVYMVTVVSLNRKAGTNYHTALSCVPSRASSSIDFDEDKVSAYTALVDAADEERSLSVVIVNASNRNGVTALYYDPATGRPRQWSVALCTVMGGIESEACRQVLVHEAIGHGLAKLADEYAYDTNGAITTTESNRLAYNHRYGWMLNVDTESDTNRILWSSFIGDSRYVSENIGAYEGAYTYMSGVYRPSEESMMRSNNSPFNAPSRMAIYNKVMALGEGREAATFDEFAAFDADHKPATWSYTTRGTGSVQALWRGVPPLLRPYPAR